MAYICVLLGHRWHTALSIPETRCLRCGKRL